MEILVEKKTNKFNCYEHDVVEKIWSFDTGVKVLYKQMIQKNSSDEITVTKKTTTGDWRLVQTTTMESQVRLFF